MQLCCPECHSFLENAHHAVACVKCGISYSIIDGVPRFVDLEGGKNIQHWDEMQNSTKRAKAYSRIKNIVSSEYHKTKHISNFIKKIKSGAAVVELGSGNRKLTDSIVNVDLFPFPNVSVVADITKTPFPSESIDYIIIDTVLEHVQEPHRVVSEIFRMLKPGGEVLCIAPFIFPYHGYPKHYFNFSADGLQYLFGNFSACKISFDMGPTSAITHLISEYFALAFSRNTTAYMVLKGLFLLPIFLLKYLDKLWANTGNAVRISSTLCASIIK